MTADTHIKAEFSLVGFWHNPYAQNAPLCLKVSCLAAGMIAGADSIDDMDLLRHGARLRRAGDGGDAIGRWRAGRAELPWFGFRVSRVAGHDPGARLAG
jgi:hypothetical protein